MHHNRIVRLTYLILIILATFLAFYRLHYPYLWQDEADTAILSKRIISYGVPKVWDNRNFITQSGHSSQLGLAHLDFNKNLVNHKMPWPQFYLTALSILIFGSNTLACRLPFAIIGLLAFVYYIYFCKKRLDLGPLYYLPGLFLLFSVPFFISIRQCRYYSLNIFLSLLFVDFFISLMQRKKYYDIYFAAVGTFFIFNNVLAFIPTLSAFFAYILLSLKKKLDIKYIAESLFLLLIGLSIYAGFIKYISGEEFSLPGFLCGTLEGGPAENFQFTNIQFFYTLLYYINVINTWCFPILIIFILTILIIMNRDNAYRRDVEIVCKSEVVQLLTLTIAANILFLSGFVQVYFRYIIHILPFFLMLLSTSLLLIYKKNKIVYVAILLLFLLTDILGHCMSRLPFFITAKAIKKSPTISALLFKTFPLQIADFARADLIQSDSGEILNKKEIINKFIEKYKDLKISYPFSIFLNKTMNPYRDDNTCIAQFLMKNSKKDDIVVANYGEEPIIFYTNLITRGGLREVGIYRIAPYVYKNAPDDIVRESFFKQFGISQTLNPDWIIIREHWASKDILSTMVRNGDYEKITLDCPDTPWGNNPDPNYYVYYDSSKDPNVIIYKNRYNHR